MATSRRRQSTTAAPSAAAAAVPSVALHSPDVMRRIAETAYYIWEKRGRRIGHDMEDWVDAEKIVLRQGSSGDA